MTDIIHRSWLVKMGRNPPPELAYVISDYRGRRVVTWADVIEERRERQRRRLEQLRRGASEWRLYKLWVAYFDQDIYGGWHAFMDTYGGHFWNSHSWIDRERKWLLPRLLEAFPPSPPALAGAGVMGALEDRIREALRPAPAVPAAARGGLRLVGWAGRHPARCCRGREGRTGAPLWPDPGGRPYHPARPPLAPGRPERGGGRGGNLRSGGRHPSRITVASRVARAPTCFAHFEASMPLAAAP